MKKFIVLAMILATALYAYPQSTRSARENKTEKGNTKKEAERQTSVSRAQQKATRAETQQRKNTQSQQKNQAATRQRNQEATQQRNNSATQQQRNNQAVRRNQRNAGSRQVDNTSTPVRPTATTRPARTHTAEPPEVRVKQTSANRVYREEKGALIKDDGTQIRHQNNEVFTKSATNFNYDSPTTFRLSADFRRNYNNYNTWYDYRITRSYDYNSSYRPMSLEYRRDRYRYREPMHYSLIWTPYLFNRFMYYYPYYTDWDIEYGYEIETISSYDAMNYVGTVRRIYGKVEEVYYSREDNNYILYLGDRFPYQDLSVVIPENIIFRITRSPIRYFDNQYIWMVGLIDLWEDKPEMVIRDEEQIRRY